MGWPRPLKALRSRTARLAGLGLAAVALMLVVGYLLLPLAVQVLVNALDVTMSVGIRLAAPGSSADASTVLMTIGRAALGALTSTWALVILGGLVLVGAIALYGLQRLLGVEPGDSRQEEEEPSR